PFAPAVAGMLEVSWYQVRAGASWRTTNRNAVLLAKASLTFTGPAATTVKLRLTNAGRSVIAKHKRVPVTVNGVFAPPHERRVLWQLWYPSPTERSIAGGRPPASVHRSARIVP